MSQDTLKVRANPSDHRQFIQTGFDLLIVSPDGKERRLPMCHARLNLGAPGEKFNDVVMDDPAIANRQMTLQYIQGHLYMNNLANALVCLVNNQPASFRKLSANDVLQIASFRINILGVQEQLASLESYTDRSRSWPVGSQPTSIGRPGKRDNVVELDDPTVSRTHACIHHHDGQFHLEAETSGSATRINGEDVTLEQPCALSDGDLIQIGEQFFRFRLAQSSSGKRSIPSQDATILFSDVSNYSAIAEGRPLEQVIYQMNEVYGALGKVILLHSGVLMTFLGDAMMAVFGAEEQEEAPAQAVRAAVAMQKRLATLNEEWQARGLPTMRIGIGIHTEVVMVVDVDDTNLAARLEDLTEDYNAGIIISGSTHLHTANEFEVRSLGTTRVKGRNTPIEIFEVLGLK